MKADEWTPRPEGDEKRWPAAALVWPQRVSQACPISDQRPMMASSAACETSTAIEHDDRHEADGDSINHRRDEEKAEGQG
ncbi:hypothetical protein EOB59_34785, partial [Mesorhizobium sp. M7A.F.Ca.MR.176.00.0.0]|uniref:hypothetical protein n=1 Tax=Mesorhizobium sp. M7A.F.Ca.MR.176.00.0.0 TaxID=2496776 RepID=UPI000FD4B793